MESAPRTGPVSRSHLLQRYALAVLLGALGYWLNRFEVPLLIQGTPEFVFGGATAFLAFTWLGPGPGLLATVLSLSGLLLDFSQAGYVTSIYILEAAAVYAISRRSGSLIVSAAIFWLTAGWVLDLPLYGWLVGLSRAYLMLLFVKQLLNSVLNALIAEAAVGVLRGVGLSFDGRARPERLQQYVFRWALFVVVLPTFALTIVYTRTGYQRRLDQAQTQQLGTAAAVRSTVSSFVRDREEALTQVTRTAEIGGSDAERESAALLARFHRDRPEFLSVGLTDAAGRVTASDPERNALGESLVGRSVGGRRYFQDARDTLRAATSPAIRGTLHVRDPKSPEPILVIASPMLNALGQFDGVVFAALDLGSLRRMLQESAADRQQVITLIDQNLGVVATLDPAVKPGDSLQDVFPSKRFPADMITTFDYRTQRDSSWSTTLGVNRRYAVFLSIPVPGWGVMVELPAERLHEQMFGPASSVLTLFVATLALVYAGAFYVSRVVSQPLTDVNRLASDIAGGRSPGRESLAALTDSAIEEIRGLGSHLLTMQGALADHRALSQARERESEERFSATFHQAAVGLGHVDPQLRWIRVNHRLCTIVGTSADALLGRHVIDTTEPEDREASADMFRSLLAGEQRVRVLEARYLRPDGTRAWTQVTASLVRDPKGVAKYFILVIEDIADRKQLEDQLLQAQKMESIGRLAGGVAHDFNNLLTAILGYTELLSLRLPADEEAREDLDQIRQAADRAATLTRQLLAFARRQVIEPKVLNLNQLVHGVEGMLRRLIGEDVELVTVLAPDLGNVRADPGQIEQVVLNLAVNARDAMPSGGRLTLRTGTVELGEEYAGQRFGLGAGKYVTLAVADQGEGMTEEVRSHIFEPFFTTKPKDKGTGLGLATCYGILKQSGGHINAESEPGRGSTFTIYLPAIEAEVALPRPESSRSAPTGGRETVLLVEDEPAVAGMAATALQRSGYDVIQASNGAEALALARRRAGRIDVLLADVVMPQMGGLELAARLAVILPDVRVLLTSGYPHDAMGGNELRPGVAFLQKPFTPAVLAQAVRDVLDRPPSRPGPAASAAV